jgi:hypothetical protein
MLIHDIYNDVDRLSTRGPRNELDLNQVLSHHIFLPNIHFFLLISSHVLSFLLTMCADLPILYILAVSLVLPIIRRLVHGIFLLVLSGDLMV